MRGPRRAPLIIPARGQSAASGSFAICRIARGPPATLRHICAFRADAIYPVVWNRYLPCRVEPLRSNISTSTEINLDSARYFGFYRNVKNGDAVNALAALAQENRLDTFRLLVQAGPGGMPAGEVAEALKIAPNTLTFHFDRLRDAGLVTVRREGRSMIYAARFKVMNALLDFLTENCCQGAVCQPVTNASSKPARKRERVP